MKHLLLNTKLLTLFLFFLLLLPSCNNEELFIAEESEIIEEEIPNDEDEDEVLAIDTIDDTVVTMENVSVNIEAHLNDINYPESITLVNTIPENGIVAINNNDTPDNLLDDSIVYTPNSGFSGIDSFDYTICDATNSENCDTAKVTITINPIEDDIATELKAFPSAYGAGAYTTGGRGGAVIHVTNLDNSGAGSLREALTMTVPRTIVFDVSGVITLTSFIGMGASNSNVTIAGQTAPEGGITIDGHRIYVANVDQVVWRYMRFRGGITAEGFGNTKNDSFTVGQGATNQIYDHCSFAWDGDETADWSAASGNGVFDKITIQRCMFGEGTKGALFGGQPSVTTGEMSMNNCLFYNITHRTPNVAGFQGSSSKIETINNVVWTIVNRLTRTDGNLNWNHIGNYYDFGTRQFNDERLQMSTSTDASPPQFYTSGNKYVAANTSTPLTSTVAEVNINNKLAHKYFQPAEGHEIGDQVNSDYFTDTQHALLGSPITVQTADDAFADVINNVGCNTRLNADGSVGDNKDVLDTGWLANVNNGIYITRSSSSTWNVPAITSKSRSGSYDTDADGMPDKWEIAAFGDLTKDGTADTDSDGYTDLEEFLNQVDNK